MTTLDKVDLIARVRALTERPVILYFCSCDGEKIPIEVGSSCTVTQLRALIMQLSGEAIVDGFQILKSPRVDRETSFLLMASSSRMAPNRYDV